MDQRMSKWMDDNDRGKKNGDLKQNDLQVTPIRWRGLGLQHIRPRSSPCRGHGLRCPDRGLQRPGEDGPVEAVLVVHLMHTTPGSWFFVNLVALVLWEAIQERKNRQNKFCVFLRKMIYKSRNRKHVNPLPNIEPPGSIFFETSGGLYV